MPLKIRVVFETRIEIFRKDKFYPLLKNHALVGKYRGLRSINVTGDWRALYSEDDIENGKLIMFHAIGTHSELYRK